MAGSKFVILVFDDATCADEFAEGLRSTQLVTFEDGTTPMTRYPCNVLGVYKETYAIEGKED